MWRLLVALQVGIVLMALPVSASADSYNGLALTPPMGFSTWNPYGCPWVTEDLVKATADAMVANGMRDAGYQYVNIDDCWQAGRSLTGPEKTQAGRVNGHLMPDPQWFSHGMKALADYVHARGLKLGLYSSHGSATCQNVAGTYGYEKTDAKDYADWGIDYFKQDTCNGGLPSDPNAFYTRYKKLSEEFLANGRDIVYSLCDFTRGGQTWLWGANVGNLWRTTGDISASFASMLSNFTSNQQWRTYAGPGHWNDPDMLEIGNAGHNPVTGGYSTLAAPVKVGDTTIQVTTNSTEGQIVGAPFRIGSNWDGGANKPGDGDVESFIVQARGTAAGAPTGIFSAAKPGDTNIKVDATAGFTVGQKILVDTIGTTGFNFPDGAGPVPSGQFESPVITNVGSAGVSTALADATAAGDRNLKVASVSGIAAGDELTLGDGDSAEVESVGTAAGAATTAIAPSQAGDTNLKLASVGGVRVGEPLVVGSGAGAERATVTGIGTAAAAESALVAPAAAGDRTVKLASVAGLVVGQPLALDSGSRYEARTVESIGTAAGAATTTVAPTQIGDTTIKVASVNGFVVGQDLALAEATALPLGSPKSDTEAARVVGIGTAAGAQTTTVTGNKVGDTTIKVSSISGFVVGQPLQIMEANGDFFETATIASIGTAAGAVTSLAAESAPGATNLKVASTSGFVVGQQLAVGVGATLETATVTAVGTAGATGTGVTVATPLQERHLVLQRARGTGTGVTVATPFALAHTAGSSTRNQGTGITVSALKVAHPLASTTSGSGQSGTPGGGISVRGTGTGVTLSEPLVHAHAGVGTVARGAGTGVTITPLTRDHDRSVAVRGLGSGLTLTAAAGAAHDVGEIVRDQSKPGTGITFDTPLAAPHTMGAFTRGGGTGITLTTPVTRPHRIGSPTGASSFTITQARTHFSLWAMAAAPLIAGSDIPNMAQQNLDILTNEDVIAIDQDRLGVAAFTVANTGGRWVLQRPLENGDTAVVLFNANSTPWTFASSPLSDLGLDPETAYLAKNLWTKQTTKVTEPLSTSQLDANETLMLRVSTRKPTLALPQQRIAADATAATGVAVSYDASAADAFGGALTPDCSRASGAVFPIGPTTVSCTATDAAGRSVSGTFEVVVAPPEHPLDVGGDVPATLALSLGAPATFGSFLPGVANDYTASSSATVTSTAGDATLSVSDPSSQATGHLVNGAFSLSAPLKAGASSPRGASGTAAPVGGVGAPTTLLAYDGPVANDPVGLSFTQHVDANDALRTGAYSKQLTFTLSTTTP